MNKEIRLRVNRIESYRDIAGTMGKRIDLVEDVDVEIPTAFRAGQTEEAKVAADVMMQIQKHFPAPFKETSNPKMCLFLTEEEYDALGIVLDVNQTYKVSFENGTIKFTDA